VEVAPDRVQATGISAVALWEFGSEKKVVLELRQKTSAPAETEISASAA
jgi:hypothetical protein